MRLVLVACVLLVESMGVDAFTGSVPLRAAAAVRGRAAAGAICSVAHGGQQFASADPLARRSFLAASLISVAGVQRVAAEDDAKEEVEAGSPGEVVVEGEMRLEVGADKKLAKVGGKGKAEVVLRCVGKGIISKTSEDINLADFPVYIHAYVFSVAVVFLVSPPGGSGDVRSTQGKLRECVCCWQRSLLIVAWTYLCPHRSTTKTIDCFGEWCVCVCVCLVCSPRDGRVPKGRLAV